VPADGSLAMESTHLPLFQNCVQIQASSTPMGRIALSAPLAFHVIVYSAIDGRPFGLCLYNRNFISLTLKLLYDLLGDSLFFEV
jgi:hypothetical protein